jgi:8-oxo-dGTP diphosphatase
MPAADQGADPARYTVIPRVVVFLRRGDDFLLLKGAPHKRLWAGKYNGVGGHLEQGEDPLLAAQRELLEETGLSAELLLCGVLVVDPGARPGVALFIFSGDFAGGELRDSPEGAPEWVAFGRVAELPVLEDVPLLLGRIRSRRPGEAPFSAHSFYGADGLLKVEFS